MDEDFDLEGLTGEKSHEPTHIEAVGIAKKRQPREDREQMILSYLCANPNLYVRAKPLLKADWFDSSNSKVAKFLLEYFTEHKALPSPLSIRGKTGVELELPHDAHEPGTMAFVASEVEAFCRDHALTDFISDTIDEKNKKPNDDYSVEEMSVMHQKMLGLTRITMTTDLGSEIYRDYKQKLQRAKETQGIRTGFDFFDEALGGGVSRPSLNIISAGTGDGKSIMMANAMINHSLIHKEDVIYYSLENSEEMTHQRMVAIMTQLNIRGLWNQMDQVDMAMFNLKNQGGGRIWIKRFPIRNTTMSKVEAHFHELQFRENTKIGAVAIDYVDVMWPTTEVERDNIAVRDAEVAQEMYEFAHTNKQIVWTGSQQTKGSGKEKEAHKDNVSGGTHKINTVDVLIIAKRSDDDTMENRIWWYIKKCRNGPGLNVGVPIHWDQESQRQSNRVDDRELFEEQNPKFFGRKKNQRQTKINRDPLVRELTDKGALSPESKGSDANLHSRMKAMGLFRKK